MHPINLRSLFLWLVVSLAGTSVCAEEPPAKTSALPDEYLATYPVGPGDVLEITVWKENELTRQVMVPPDGFISFPHAGTLKAEGKTIDQIKLELQNRLGEIIVDPIVNVFLMGAASNKIYVIGKVNRPGEYPITGATDVMQALSMAGGLATFADEDGINILRRTNGKQESIPFSYSDVVDGDNLEQNIPLKKGDVVVVQ